ncbi:tyrosine-type recombinase/integrase [Kitasatospora sp. LaBMicrA B282]|uniref:tyrosine-type recombinase/integrase n=1 Tax=Kitasatospora sp. LaBMicrA B282 TaxID=3420949 RepID=UPI003D0CB46C
MTLTEPQLPASFVAFKGTSPLTGAELWTVVTADYEPHAEAAGFLQSLRAADASANTQRAYAGRVALYLRYCESAGLDWATPRLHHLSQYMQWLVETPIARQGRGNASQPRYRSKGTANAHMTAVVEFLRHAAIATDRVPESVVKQLSEPRHLAHLPPGFDTGEDGSYRTIRARAIKFRVAVEGYEWLTPDQIDALIDSARHARDRFLIYLLAVTGMRIGEALGLRREDMHFLSSSTMFGCREKGPHVHVRRRLNSNGALAKTRTPRAIPVSEPVADYYAEYQRERDSVPEASSSDLVFVNLFHAPLGQPMRYASTKENFDRLAKRAGFPARPHMLRHSAITQWAQDDVPRDVIQSLAGHVSPQSMTPYIHTSDEAKRAAIESVASKFKRPQL